MHLDYNPSYNDTENLQDFSNYGETLKSPIHAAKFPSAVNAKNDNDYDYFVLVYTKTVDSVFRAL